MSNEHSDAPPRPALPATGSGGAAGGPGSGPRASLPARSLAEERAYHDRCRAALDGMVVEADAQVVTGENAFASGADAEVLGRHLRSRAKELRLQPDGPLFFGRLDFDDGTPGQHRGQSYHIGRRRITEHPSSPPLVVDWRAPVSRAFYRAGPHDPQGVAVRRRFGWAPGSRGRSAGLTGLEDEYLIPDAAERGVHTARGTAGRLGAGSVLTGEIERPRVGPMRDIAATIQPEQDELVRSDLGLSLCVQGAPGTGKTAVGLHRAAYLLFTYPQRLKRSGLLILGPSRTFLAYIAEVLPSLGEGGVRQSVLADEIARHVGHGAGTAQDSPAAAVVKHDVRMAEVLHRALYGRVALPEEPLTVPEGRVRRRVGLAVMERIVADVRAEAPPYAVGRERVRSRAVREILLQVERRSGPRPAKWVRKVERSRALTEYLDRAWPRTTPHEVLEEVLADPARWADGILTAQEQQAIRRTPSGRRAAAGTPPAGRRRPARRAGGAEWTDADLVLLDELAGLVEHPGTYGHIVVDEAQDLSPMECRAIARRVPFGSLTVLGDLAQGTTPWAARSWPALLAHLGRPDAVFTPLTTGFRVPKAVVDLANRLLGSLDVAVPPTRSLRGDGELTVRSATHLAAAVVDAVRSALAREGSVGVIADASGTDPLRAALTAAGIATASTDTVPSDAAPSRTTSPDTVPSDAAPSDAAPPRVTVLAASEARGLEYDHVVLVEPAAIAEAEDRGLNRLYVALTRAVSRLDIIGTRPLPRELEETPGDGTGGSAGRDRGPRG